MAGELAAAFGLRSFAATESPILRWGRRKRDENDRQKQLKQQRFTGCRAQASSDCDSICAVVRRWLRSPRPWHFGALALTLPVQRRSRLPACSPAVLKRLFWSERPGSREWR